MYRRAYGCTDNIQRASREVFGHCFVERNTYNAAATRGLQELGKKKWEEATDHERAKIAAWAEAWVYQVRVQAYVLLKMAGEVNSPSHDNLLRYQTSALNAMEIRLQALLQELPGKDDVSRVA